MLPMGLASFVLPSTVLLATSFLFRSFLMGVLMATKPFNVLRVNAIEEQTRYRSAIARILVNIQHEYGITLAEIAEAVDVSLGTISNAANKKCDLTSIYRDRLAMVFGGHVLNPLAAIHGCQIIPLHGRDDDILPLITRAAMKIADARSPKSDKGAIETHREKLGYLPDLKALQSDLGTLIVEIEEIAA
jgi:predicted XRE-type DNA-binding protein